MNVVIVCDFGSVNGGAANVAITSARGLADAGVAVSYVCAIPPLSPFLDHPRIKVHLLSFENVWERGNPLAAAAQGIWNGRALHALMRVLAPLPCEQTIVHLHQWSKALSPSVLGAPLRLGLPTIVSLHDYFLACPNGAYYRFPKAEPCTLAPMSLACLGANCDRVGYAHKAVRVLRQRATRRVLASAGASLSLLFVSPLAERVIGRFLPAAHRRFVLRSPVDIARGEAAPVADNHEFLFVGRLTEEKGVLALAKVAHEAQFPLTIAGDGPLLDELRAIGGTVRCLGWLDPKRLRDVIAKARALVFPSTWYETGGLVVLEALARGVPAIVSARTGIADLIADGENGFVVEPGDKSALLAAMRALTDDACAARMGAEAYRRYWADPQTPDVHTQGLLDVYRTVLEERARTPLTSTSPHLSGTSPHP